MQPTEKFTETAKEVIQIELQAISALLDRIGHPFDQACHYLLDCLGRIIVTGMGKSGHIAKKIAATLASTGSPAFFVHPAEAKHGDMGMITSKDVLLALSHSGESEEMISLLPFLKRLNIPLIALTGKPNSTLAKAATVHLDVSVPQEACPLGLAPTSSTTAALVMGDAISIALLKRRGFTAEDFALSHPGGTLGKRLLLTVNDIMHTGDRIPTVNPETLLKDALIEMTQKKLGMTTVINENGELIGIFTDGDIRRAFDHQLNLHQTQIHQVMSREPKLIQKDILAIDALKLMESHQITALVITNEMKHPIGLIHLHDILRAGVI